MNVEINIQVILDRLKEPSTYAAIAAPMLTLGIASESTVASFAGAVGMIASILGMAISEGKTKND